MRNTATVICTIGRAWSRQIAFRDSVRWTWRSSLGVLCMERSLQNRDPLFRPSHILHTLFASWVFLFGKCFLVGLQHTRGCIHGTCTSTVACHFLIESLHFNCPKLTQCPNSVSFYSNCQRGSSPWSLASYCTSKALPTYHNDSTGLNSYLEKPHRTNSNDLNSCNQSRLVFQKSWIQPMGVL
jgi:hypothetical protein